MSTNTICENKDLTPHRFIDILPSKIQIGDIIEVHMTFMAIPQKDGKKKVMVTLRSVTLLDGNLTEVCVLTDRF